eukprot:g33313.t1
MGKSKRHTADQRLGGSNRKPTVAQSVSAKEVPVDKALPGITSQVEYPSLQAASNESSPGQRRDGLHSDGLQPRLVQNAQRAPADASTSSVKADNQTVTAIMDQIEKKVEAMRPQREQLKRCIEACLCDALAGHSLEVVGSTAWGGEVPQSDLDLVLVTPSSNLDPPQALVLLQSLLTKLESQAEGERAWARLELVEARKVPLLRLYDRAGLSCDVVVDQLHALEHRKLLVDALEGRPEVKRFIRLVKYWLRQRGLPVGSEGGLPSFAWAYSALQLALQLPGSSVEQLLFYFFKQLNLLSRVEVKEGSGSLVTGVDRVHLGGRSHTKAFGEPQTAQRTYEPMSSGLLGDYASDGKECDEDDPLKDGFAARQAIAEQFAQADFDEVDNVAENAEGACEDQRGDAKEIEIEATKIRALQPGVYVRAENLKQAQALNGRVGVVKQKDADREGRWQVEFWSEDGSICEVNASIKSENLFLDSNELAAAILEAELAGDEETLASLQAELAARESRGDMEVIGAIIGTGGAAIKQMAAESGARMSFEQEEYQPGYLPLTRCCLISGPADAVAKAKALLQEAVSVAMAGQAQGRKGKGKGKGQRKGTPMNLASDLVGEGAGGRAGFQQGICKWYAAGFCKFHSETGCRNGLHDTTAALKAEADWELGRFHRFVRPGYWTREEWSMRNRFNANCFNNGANSISFPEVVDDLLNWLRELLNKEPGELRSEDFLFVTCGNWDVKSAIPRQCCNPAPGTVDLSLQKLLFSRWSNLKEVFRDFYKLPVNSAPTGMRGMLKMLRIPLSGQHHLGMDDVSNLAKILQRLIHEGCSVGPTGQASQAPVWNPKGLKGKGKDGKGGKGGKGKGDKGKGKDFGKDFRKGKFKEQADQGAQAELRVDCHTEEPLAWGIDVPGAAVPPEAAEEPMKPNRELEEFLNGAPIPGTSWGEEENDELEKEQEQPEPDPLAEPRARPGEDWTSFMDMSFDGEERACCWWTWKNDEETGEQVNRSLKRPDAPEAEGDDQEPGPVFKPCRETGKEWPNMAEDGKRKSDGPEADAKRQKNDKGEVMSLEQVLAKRKEENKAPKLKFVSKNDREKNAAKEADKQKAEQKKKAEEASKRRKDTSLTSLHFQGFAFLTLHVLLVKR